MSELQTQFVPRSKHSALVIKTDVICCIEKIRCSFSDARKNTKIYCGQNIEFFNVKAGGRTQLKPDGTR